MTCAERRASLLAYLENELPAPERAELETHLSGCAACREALAAERRLSTQLSGLPPVRPRGDFEARFWARIARGEVNPSESLAVRIARWLRPRRLVALGGVVALAVAAVLALRAPSNGDVVDWQIAADAEDFELLQDPDLDIAEVADLLQAMDPDTERGRGPG